MKKLMVIIVGVISITSIFIVLFFGVLPFSKDPNVYCDYVVMNLQTIMHNDDHIVDVYKRPDDSEIKSGDDWYDNDYNYRVRVKDSDYFFNNMNGKLNLYCEAKTNKVGKLVSDPKLNYYCYDPVNPSTYISDYTNGIISFTKEAFISTGNPIPFTFRVISNDAHKQFINIRIQVARISELEGDNL